MKFIKWIFAGLYILVILCITIIGRTALPEPIFKGLFWEYQSGMWSDIILNILLFVPLGLIIGGWKGVLIGFGLSGVIEISQYFYRRYENRGERQSLHFCLGKVSRKESSKAQRKN